MLVKEIMSKDLIDIQPTASVCEAAEMMKRFDIGALPILDGQQPQGFITDRDISIRCIAEHKNPETTKVAECMTKDIVTVHEEDTLEAASDAMCENRVRRVLVLDENEKPVGILNLKHISECKDPALINKTIQKFYLD